MAKVCLESYESRVQDLPSLCLRCGAPTSTIRYSKSFSWHPSWVAVLLLAGLLPYVIVAIVLTKRARVEAPLCDKHKYHWVFRLLFMLGCPLLLCGMALLCWIAALSLQGPNGDAGGWICAGSAILFVFWLIAAAIVENFCIRPVEITDTSITLSGVSEDFAQAYEDELEAWEKERDEARERWSDRERRRSDKVRRPPRDYEEDRPDTYHERER